MANGILDFFSREAGQQQRKALDEAIGYYIPPNLRGLLGFAAEMTPTRGIERAGQASQELFAPGTPGWDRVSALGDMASEIAGVVAPAAVAGKVGMPAAQALQEGLMGFSTSPQGAALRNFAGDESGALRLWQGSPHDFAAERLVRMADGSTQYVVGKPNVLPDVPAGAELLRDFPLGRMRMDKIGTGEGAQAYGHGLYAAESEPIARHYRDTLARGIDGSGLEVRIDKATVAAPTTDQIRAARFGVDATANGLRGRIAEAQRRLEKASPIDELGLGISDRDMVQGEIDDLVQRLNAVQGLAGRIEMAPAGRMYEVNVNANPEDFLDWDKPLSEQPKSVQDFANARWQQIFGRAPDQTLEGEYIVKMASPQGGIDSPDWLLLGGPGDAQRARLLEAGIPGIRYLDAGSRGAGDGSRNYVLFDENLIDIVKKYGIAGAAAMLGVNAIDVEQAMAQGRQQPQGLLGYGVQ